MASSSPTSRRATVAIAAATLGVYVLLLAGATAAIVDAVAVCSSWPACGGSAFPSLDTPRLAIAWGHRLVALAVGALVVAAGVLGWRESSRRRVRGALALAVVGYPVQVGLGALVAGNGGTGSISGLHLAAGVGIFGALLSALAWSLEPRDAGTESGSTVAAGRAAPEGDDLQGDAGEPSPGAVEAASGTGDSIADTIRAYVSLTKPRLMWLLCLVAAAGMALAAGESLDPRTVAATLLGGVLAIGSSGTFNHVLERDVDRRMQRTSDRPLATDRVGVRNALAFGVLLGLGAVAVFLTINVLAAVLGLAAIAYYSVVYTLLLKPNTVQNTVIGGLAGSFPAAIGAAAATNTVGLPALALAAVIFLWTPAHFYNLALAYKEDYARGGFPMMPVVRGEATTRKHVLYYLGATFVASAALAAIADLGVLYAATAVVFGAVFLWAVVRLHREATERAALRSFHASNAYLGSLLVAILVDVVVV